jgi:hypothetical protein
MIKKTSEEMLQPERIDIPSAESVQDSTDTLGEDFMAAWDKNPALFDHLIPLTINSDFIRGATKQLEKLKQEKSSSWEHDLELKNLQSYIESAHYRQLGHTEDLLREKGMSESDIGKIKNKMIEEIENKLDQLFNEQKNDYDRITQVKKDLEQTIEPELKFVKSTVTQAQVVPETKSENTQQPPKKSWVARIFGL